MAVLEMATVKTFTLIVLKMEDRDLSETGI
jgi:hypothetical protein